MMIIQNLTEWDQDVVNNPEEDYQAFLRGLLWHDGFELAFVRCSPAGGMELVKKVRNDLPQKQIGVLELDQPIDNLIDRVKDVPNQSQLDILFVVGLEKSLVDYIQTGYGGQGDYYNLDTIPPILSHLNWQRENFRDRFRHICFVFLLPRFALKYIIRRAPDFFDWGSGIVEFPTSREFVERESRRIMLQGDYQKYLGWTSQQRTQNIIEIDELLTEQNQTQNHQVSLLSKQGNIFNANEQYEEAIICYDKALKIKPDYFSWHNRGVALANLGRYEEAITCYDKTLEINPDYYLSWHNRGIALANLR
jgi:tetratricopeptide (TPR) repeat protein